MARKNSPALRRQRHAKLMERALEEEAKRVERTKKRANKMPTDAQRAAKKRTMERRLEQERKFLAKKGLRLVKEDEGMDVEAAASESGAADQPRKRMRAASSS